MFRMDKISKSFINNNSVIEVLRELTLDVKAGEFVSIVGPSGCGKTTLLKICAGLLKPDKGSILLEGKEVEGPSYNRGMVFQSYPSFPWLTVRQNIEFGLKIRKESIKEYELKIKYLIKLMNLTGFENSYPNVLSGGMKQRLALARTLINEPKVLLLDEPFGSLDNQTRMMMQEYLLEIQVKMQNTTIFVTHDIEEAIYLADRLIVMSNRPSKIIMLKYVNFRKSRSRDIRYSQSFVDLKKEVNIIIRKELI